MLAKLNRLFQIAPVKVKARDGSGDIVVVEHRIGKDGGALTSKDLMSKLGLEAEYAELYDDLQKKFKDRDKMRQLADKLYSGQLSKMRKIVQKYRSYLEQFYAAHPRPLLPMFAFVPITDTTDGLYLQGLLDEGSLKLVVGEPEDDALWNETIFTKTKTFADLNARAKRAARALMSHPGLNKDIAYRMEFISKGQVPDKLVFEQGAKE